MSELEHISIDFPKPIGTLTIHEGFTVSIYTKMPNRFQRWMAKVLRCSLFYVFFTLHVPHCCVTTCGAQCCMCSGTVVTSRPEAEMLRVTRHERALRG